MASFEYFRIQDLKDYVIRYLSHWGIPAEDSAIVADVLISADARGVDSHGLIRLYSYYGARLQKGLIDPHPEFKVITETSTTLSIDAGNGLGHPVGDRAMRMCMQKANSNGVAFATVRNSNHYGIAGYYAMLALQENMIGVSLTNSQPLVAPTHGKRAMLGTNPIAVAVPAGKNLPYVLDMATSIVPIGRVSVYQKNEKPIPAGWGIDADGAVTEDPGSVVKGGALMPLGGTELMRGYKGYGLALLVDIFCGVLAGSGFGTLVTGGDNPDPARVGHFFAAVRIDAFRPLQDFLTDMDNLLEMMKSSPKAVGEERIYIHGEKEFEKAALAEKEGVPLSGVTVNALKQSGDEIGIPFDLNPLKQVN